MTASCSASQIGRMQWRSKTFCKFTVELLANLEKSSIHFAKGRRQGTRTEMKAILDVHNKSLSEKYLGMPSDVRSSSNGAFKYLKDRVWKRVQGWMEQCLSANFGMIWLSKKIWGYGVQRY